MRAIGDKDWEEDGLRATGGKGNEELEGDDMRALRS